MRLPGLAICLLCVVMCTSIGFAQTKRRARTVSAKPTAQSKQTPQREPSAPPMPVLPDLRSDPDVQDADVAIIANITAKELRFEAVPNPTVEFLAKDKTQTVWHADRYNLPDKIEPGVTYRNIGIRLKITSRLADIDRIVAEALGEIPITDSDENKSGSSHTAIAPTSNSQRQTTTVTNTPATRRGPNE